MTGKKKLKINLLKQMMWRLPKTKMQMQEELMQTAWQKQALALTNKRLP
jgi:hypothetical protein